MTPTESEISRMLTELSETLDEAGITTMRGDRISKPTTKLVIVDAYVDGAIEIITEGLWAATVYNIGQGISIIKPVY